MLSQPSFTILDDDDARAAAIAAELRRLGCRVRPASAGEDNPADTIVLAADDGPRYPAPFERLDRSRARNVIAYAASPTAHRIVWALSTGASDYLAWPCDVRLIIAAGRAAKGATSWRAAFVGRADSDLP